MELPPGFRFHPTDEELVNHYLIRKCASLPIYVPIIKEIDLYKFDPWQLPEMALYGEKEWYFFSPRDRKYPNGSRPNRAAGRGYWKATGADKPIGKPKPLGIKKALVFYSGKAPRGVKTNWIMHEYRLANVDRSASKKNNSRLDDWVLCRIYNKKGSVELKNYPTEQKFEVFNSEFEDKKPDIALRNFPNDHLYMDTSDSIPKPHSHTHTTDSSCTEHVLSPEITYDNREAQSQPKWNNGFENNNNAFDNFNYMEGFLDQDPFGSQVQFQLDQLSPLQDMFTFLQKPF